MSHQTNRLAVEFLEARTMLAADTIGLGATTIPGNSNIVHELEIAAVGTDGESVNSAYSLSEESAIRLPSIFVAPDTIVADSDGQFSYQAVFTAGNDNPQFAFWQQQNLKNTNVPGLVADGFCLSTMAQGEQFIINVSGRLVDSTSHGLVQVDFGTCNPYNFFTKVTTIRPSNTFLQTTIETATVDDFNAAGNFSFDTMVNEDSADTNVIHEQPNTVKTNAGQIAAADVGFRGRLHSTSSSELTSANGRSRMIDAVMAEIEMQEGRNRRFPSPLS